MRPLVLVVLLATTLNACGGDDGPQGGAAVAESLDCTGWADDSEELYVAEGGSCEGPDGTLVVNWFDSESERDSWIDVAENFGDLDNLQKGDQWVAYTP